MNTSRHIVWSAWGAGVCGVLAVLLLLVLYALLAVDSAAAESVGTVDDLLGVPETALMIPVALAVGHSLPRTRTTRVAQVVAVGAMTVAAVVAPLMVFGLLPFDVETPVSAACFLVIMIWVFLVSRVWHRENRWQRTARVGLLCGRATLIGLGVCVLGLALPWLSWPQLVVIGVGVTLGLLAYLLMPVWFLLLAQALRSSQRTG